MSNSMQWKIKPLPAADELKRITRIFEVDPITAILFHQRGVHHPDEGRRFFNPAFEDLYDPMLMKDMDKAVARIVAAKDRNEKILIIGDYDVDGTTGTALLYLFLTTTIFKNDERRIDYYIPDRYTEGYGVSIQGIDYGIAHGVKLIITVDCGIKANDKVQYALERGVDMIICDHHLPGETVPAAAAVLDPMQPGCRYPYNGLSGCAVAYKLLQALAAYYKLDDFHWQSLIDLVAVSIASDIVPVTGENRTLAYLGLKKLNQSPLNGLRAVMTVAGLSGKNWTIEDIVFKIGPRINAAGRLHSGRTAVELLITGDNKLAEKLSREINSYNNERKGLDKTITAEALEIIRQNPEHAALYSTVVYNENWHKGVVGIVASRLIETYYRPTIVLTRSNGLISGSARSVEGFDLYQAIEKCGHLLEKYGGHSHAAGITLRQENIQPFSELFEKVVRESIKPEQLNPVIEIDAEIRLHDISENLVAGIERLEPFGPGNMSPLFCTCGITERGTARPVGTTGDHLKLDITDPASPSYEFPAIAFQLAHVLPQIRRSKMFDICYSIEKNEFRGKVSIQLNIRDFRFYE